LGRVPTTSGDAYGHYLAALATTLATTPEGNAIAIAELRRAVEIDPTFALAWAKLAYTLTITPTWEPDRTAEYQQEALEIVQRALALEPELTEAHIALSFLSTVRGNWLLSEQEYRQALERGATRAEMPERGVLELAVGHIEQARKTLAENLTIDPTNTTAAAFMLAALEISGDKAAVDEEYRRGNAFSEEWPFGQYIMNYIRLGRNEPDTLVDDSAVRPSFRADFADSTSSSAAVTALRSWYASIETPNHNEQLVVAAWAAHYGDLELALTAAEAATETRVQNIWFLWLPLFDDVRRTPGFKELVVERTLVDYWREYGWPAACRPVGDSDLECA
jgi:tetratricopeptide (TPR) repeat protein